jgi:hypothetical protein
LQCEFKEKERQEMKKRNYQSEYRNYHSKPDQKTERASRNAARRQAEKDGRVRKGDGKDIDHVDKNPLNNAKSNTRVRPKSVNRSFPRNKNGGHKK